MVSLTELLAVLLLAVCQHEKWKNKVVLYMGDNQVVIRWINKRQAKHPFANYLLQLLAALEACYGIFLRAAYLRTYRNVVADALARKDAEQAWKRQGSRDFLLLMKPYGGFWTAGGKEELWSGQAKQRKIRPKLSNSCK